MIKHIKICWLCFKCCLHKNATPWLYNEVYTTVAENHVTKNKMEKIMYYMSVLFWLFSFSRYNKRINDIRECKEQALSHAYVHSLSLIPSSHSFQFVTHRFSPFLWSVSLATFSLLFIRIPLTFFPCFPPLTSISTLPPAFSFSFGECHIKTLPSSYPHPSFFLSSSPLFVSPPAACLFSAFILITYSVFPFHLHSHSPAVICHLLTFVLQQDCPESVKITV